MSVKKKKNPKQYLLGSRALLLFESDLVNRGINEILLNTHQFIIGPYLYT